MKVKANLLSCFVSRFEIKDIKHLEVLSLRSPEKTRQSVRIKHISAQIKHLKIHTLLFLFRDDFEMKELGFF